MGEICGTKAKWAVILRSETMSDTAGHSSLDNPKDWSLRCIVYSIVIMGIGHAADSLVEQTEVLFVSLRVEAANNPPPKQKRQAQTPTSKPAKKRDPVDHSSPPSCIWNS